MEIYFAIVGIAAGLSLGITVASVYFSMSRLKHPPEVPKIEITIPPIKVEMAQTKADKTAEERQHELNVALQKAYYDQLEKEEKENKNKPAGDRLSQDLNKTVNIIYDALLNGDALGEEVPDE